MSKKDVEEAYRRGLRASAMLKWTLGIGPHPDDPETWDVRGSDGDELRIGETRIAMFDSADRTRCQLASAAPDMARALLAVEWGGSACIDIEVYAECCPRCGGIAPDYHNLPKAKAEGEHIGHKPDCALDAALRKAGVR